MSFIRCLSNPEGLYIWDDVGGFIAITGKKIRGMWKVDQEDWYGLIRNYKRGYIPAKCGDLALSFTKGYKVRLTTPEGSVTMWETTWYYIASHCPRG
jgi:hypothetical protein